MKFYNVWVEGYCATGGSSPAMYIGGAYGASFSDAVHVVMGQNHPTEKVDSDRGKLSWWGCRFFDNEIDAKASFG